MANPERDYLARIEAALASAADELSQSDLSDAVRQNAQATKLLEQRISARLRESLLRPGEGWLCEEDVDSEARLACDILWAVDPIDGTQEFVTGLPEWSISVGLVQQGQAIAGGVLNPVTHELVLGSLHEGTTYNGRAASVSPTADLGRAVVLASRQEHMRGAWARFDPRPFAIRPMGSVAYKLALVAAGLADATWTLCPKHEWDVAAGVALVISSGGRVQMPGNAPLRFNCARPLLPGLIATNAQLWSEVNELLAASSPSLTEPSR